MRDGYLQGVCHAHRPRGGLPQHGPIAHGVGSYQKPVTLLVGAHPVGDCLHSPRPLANTQPTKPSNTFTVFTPTSATA